MESAFSQQDKNLFSELHNQDNNGQAFALGVNLKDKPLGASDYTLSTGIETAYLSKNFSIIDRFRNVEYDRNWGILVPGNQLGNQDITLGAHLKLAKNALNFINYSINYRAKKATINGLQHSLSLAKGLGKVQLLADAFRMDGKTPQTNTTWKRFKGEAYLTGKWQPGYRFLTERHRVTALGSDSIVASQNFYDEHQVFVRALLSHQNSLEVLYSKRFDKLPVQGELQQGTDAETVTTKVNTRIGANHSLKMAVNYRLLVNNAKPAPVSERISGRVDWNGVIIPGAIRSELTYSLANARVPKREYVFVEVPTGEGTHTWRDENGDGIKDLDEFYEAFNYDEKQYIKLYVPSNNFIDAFNNRLNYRLILGFPMRWANERGFKKLLGGFSNTTSWTTRYSTTENSLQARLIPFLGKIDTAQLLSASEYLRTTFFFNKNNPVFGINAGYVNRSRKVLYANGFEGSAVKEYNAVVRWSVKRKYQFELHGLLAEHQSSSDYLIGRNFTINEQRVKPLLAWQPKPTVRITTSYTYGLSAEPASSEAVKNSANLNEVGAELRVGTASKFVFNTSFKLTQINFIGVEKSPVGYELLKGLRPGTNYSLVVSWQQRLVNGLQIQLFYQGRKPEGIAIIHSMRAGITALF